MSQFEQHIEWVIKHWPSNVTTETPIVRKFAEISALADLKEQDIQEFCSMVSDLRDDSFTNGIHAANQS